VSKSLKLKEVRNNQPANSMFLYEYQRAVLLALREMGNLSHTQYEKAEAMLRKTTDFAVNRSMPL